MRRVGLIQHENDSPPGTALPWLKQRGFDLVHRQMDLGHPLPHVQDVDDLVICGGSMNVDEESKFPWLKTEKKLIEDVLAKGGRIVGLCLGAQLTAEVLGASVHPHLDWEVGWHPVQLRPQNGTTNSEVSLDLPVFQWHRYVFELPAGAERLARNSWWENQAFAWKEQVLGFQFHPETDLKWNRECALDRGLPTTGQTQSAEEILRLGELHQPKMQKWFEQTLQNFFN